MPVGARELATAVIPWRPPSDVSWPRPSRRRCRRVMSALPGDRRTARAAAQPAAPPTSPRERRRGPALEEVHVRETRAALAGHCRRGSGAPSRRRARLRGLAATRLCVPRESERDRRRRRQRPAGPGRLDDRRRGEATARAQRKRAGEPARAWGGWRRRGTGLSSSTAGPHGCGYTPMGLQLDFVRWSGSAPRATDGAERRPPARRRGGRASSETAGPPRRAGSHFDTWPARPE